MTNRIAARGLLVAAVWLAAAGPAAGQVQEVSFDAGRVTITARETPLAAILDAWEQHGGSRFVGAGRLSERSVAVRLVDVDEREALRVLLRSAGGYVAIPRSAPAPGASAFDRIFIMAGGARPPAARLPGGAAAAFPAGGAHGQPRQPDQPLAAGGALAPGRPGAALDELDEFDALDERDELALVERLRQRYRTAAPAATDAEPGVFRSQSNGSSLRTTPRPGMAVEADEPRNRPNPVRQRNRDR